MDFDSLVYGNQNLEDDEELMAELLALAGEVGFGWLMFLDPLSKARFCLACERCMNSDLPGWTVTSSPERATKATSTRRTPSRANGGTKQTRTSVKTDFTRAGEFCRNRPINETNQHRDNTERGRRCGC